MATLTALHGAGSGLVGVILPDTTSSVRYVNFDAPYLTKAFQMAGYSSSEFKIETPRAMTPPSWRRPRRTSRTAPRYS
jgi:D-xylose transport system substrate-binding protein